MWRKLPFRILPPSGLLTLSIVAVTLVGIIGLELRPPNEAPAPAEPVRKQLPSPPVSASHEPSKHQDDQYLATILARPLFSPTRRPPPAAPVPKDAAPGLARLTGVIVSPAGKSAIFADSKGGKPIVVGEGAQIGGYVVGFIDVGAVTITGPEGQRILHPVFDPNPPSPRQPPPAKQAVPAPITPPTAAPPAARQR